MDNVLPFTRERHSFARSVKADRGTRDGVAFVTGVAATMIAPAVGYCSNGGPVRPGIFVGVVMLGTIIGLIKYGGFFNDRFTVLTIGTGARNNASVEPELKKAA